MRKTNDTHAPAHPLREMEGTFCEPLWLRDAKAVLLQCDPVDVANETEALARWADHRCRDILRAASAKKQPPDPQRIDEEV